ncbi:FAD-dependent oxidoreductase [Litorivivens sp.]|uniref:FAD-dependent oxidoreductase n=2 Tax=Litorivivens sp. TaxID=2020868 RepID=UPI00356A0E79
MNEHFDFIVVGSGAGSMCAALKLRAAGKSVLVLEKTDLIGGTTATSGGVMWIPNNRYMQTEGIHDSREDAITYLEHAVGDSDDTPGASRTRREAYVDQAPEMLEFLIGQGCQFRRVPEWPDYYQVPGYSESGRTVVSELFDLKKLDKEWQAKLRPGFIPIPAYLEEAMQLGNMKRSKAAKKAFFRMIGRTLWSKLRGKNLVTAGHALQGQLLHAALQAGAEVRVNSSVNTFILDNGRVVGIVASSNGQAVEIGASLGVLINAGGFARNQAMLDEYIPGARSDWTNANPGDTGEVLQEAMRIGAAVAQMDERVGSPCTLPPGDAALKPAMQGDLCKPHSMLIDQSGKRFMRETVSYMAQSKAILEHNKNTPAIPSYLILDSQYLNKFMLAGSMPGKKKPKEWFESNFLLTGDTLEALAQACGIDPTALKSSVERFNGFVDKGIDEDFGRGSEVYDRWLGDRLSETHPSLGRIEQGPFYALRIYPGDLGTYGGLVTDEHARVLRDDGQAIDGLYATGTSTASVMGRITPGAGGSIGPSITWAYVAAKHAAAQA